MNKTLHRKKIRIPHYDYASAGIYFITLCTLHKAHLFGAVHQGVMSLNQHGKWINDCWLRLSDHFNGTHLDSYVIMPNHMHALLHLVPGHKVSLSTIVGSFKSAVSKQFGAKIWQRGYWDRVIRSERELELARQYIINNPAKWGSYDADDY
ncbi:transposase [Serratia sp. NPDC078593]|uniref:transposase n=1 Tax=unclassified Serratia (in: enterobacteria) TaxID=2647522 RepID=UPI0037CEDB79